MSAAVKKVANLDERGRITLPKSCRKTASSFSIEPLSDGTIRLVPQKSLPLREIAVLESLKESIRDFKKGKTKKVPADWIK